MVLDLIHVRHPSDALRVDVSLVRKTFDRAKNGDILVLPLGVRSVNVPQDPMKIRVQAPPTLLPSI